MKEGRVLGGREGWKDDCHAAHGEPGRGEDGRMKMGEEREEGEEVRGGAAR